MAGIAAGVTALAACDAHAFCRTVTAMAPAGYDPATSGCLDSQGGPGIYNVYWANLCVGYSLERNGSPLRGISLAEATSVTDAAFSEWSALTCPTGGSPSITATDEGPVDCDKVEYNSCARNQHVIVFRDEGWPYDDASNTLGLTTVTYDTTDGEIYDADMELNTHDYPFVVTSPVPAGSYDLRTVITHEAGHFLGLAHSTDITAVMYSHYRAGASLPTADDVVGICSMYGPDGARTTSSGPLAGAACDPTPRHGFSTQCGSALATICANAADGGEAENPARSTSGKCSVAGGAPGGPGWIFGPAGLLWIGWLARVWRRRARRARATGAVPRLVSAR